MAQLKMKISIVGDDGTETPFTSNTFKTPIKISREEIDGLHTWFFGAINDRSRDVYHDLLENLIDYMMAQIGDEDK